ncbi:MAG: efflux RND transporter periplasmic adaptor subunit [Planctomycetia bacterium]|nr:efflux RND transporter periplasmic adaptor subunit [Planctomycetia bacterium]
MKYYLAGLVTLIVVAGSLVVISQWRRPPQAVSGFVEAYDVRVGSRVGGRVERVLVNEGDQVVQDQPLVELAPFDLRERLAEAQATLAAKQADLERLTKGYRREEIDEAAGRRDQLAARLQMLTAGPRKQEKEISQLQLQIAQRQLERAIAKYRRTQDVFRQGQATQDEMDEATLQKLSAEAMVGVRQQEVSLADEGTRREEIDEAKARLAGAQAAWELLKNGYRTEEIAAAKAAVAAAAAAVGIFQKQLEELTIRAKVNGVVEALDLRPGDLVAPNAPVLSLLDNSTLWVTAFVPENKLNLKINQILPITIDSFPGRKFRGQITYISHMSEFTPRNVQTIEERSKQVYRMKVKLLDGLDVVRPGMVGDVWLDGR